MLEYIYIIFIFNIYCF